MFDQTKTVKHKKPEEKYYIPLQSAPFPVAIVTNTGVFRESNQLFMSFFDYSLVENALINIQDVIITNEHSPEEFRFKELITHRKNDNCILCRYNRNNENQTFVLNINPIEESTSDFLITIKDLTLWIDTQDILISKQEEFLADSIKKQEWKTQLALKKISKSRLETLGEIASGISHELKQPLAHLSLKIDNLLDRWLDGTITEDYLRSKTSSIQRQIDRMKAITNQIKDFASPPEQKNSVLDLKTIINNALEDITQINLPGLSITIDLKPNSCVMGSANELEQVFVNLLTNSIQSLHIKSQFSKDFKPKIEIKSYIDTSVIINLTDNGIGLEQHQTTKIFTPFYTTKKAVGGTGLGLFIVSDLLRKMNGDITITSVPNQFFQASISLPKGS